MLTKMVPCDTNTTRIIKTNLGNDYYLLIFSRVNIVTRWIKFNVFNNISCFNLHQYILPYLPQNIVICIRA